MDLRLHGRSNARRVRIADAPEDDEADQTGVELEEIKEKNDGVRRPQRFEDDEELSDPELFEDDEEEEDDMEDPPIRSGTRSPRHKFEIEDPKMTSSTKAKSRRPVGRSGRALGGHIANAYYGRRDATRDKVRDENRIREAQPKFIEAALKEQRNRLRSRRREKSICPDPVRAIRRFLRDPVTRFWLGCNLCCFGSLFLISFLFLGLLYPTVLRPITKY